MGTLLEMDLLLRVWQINSRLGDFGVFTQIDFLCVDQVHTFCDCFVVPKSTATYRFAFQFRQRKAATRMFKFVNQTFTFFLMYCKWIKNELDVH